MLCYTKICPITLNTTRLCGTDSVGAAVETSKAGFSSLKPNAVILINKYEVFDGIGASSLVHFPINAPILFTDGNMLNDETLAEIQRLAPRGYKGIQVILVGNVSINVALQLNKSGLTTRRIIGVNHYETACKITDERKGFQNILIMSGEDYSEGISSAFWAAHHGDPILFVQKDSIPNCTLEAIKRMHNINAYIIGSARTVSKTVESALAKLSNVSHTDRIDGNNPYDITINFAKYKDPSTEFGWGRNYREGHAFTFGTLSNPMAIIAGVILAHMGKHSPLLLIQKDSVPASIINYLQSVKPLPPKDMPRPPFMHGFILGDINQITYNAQIKIEDTLAIEHEMKGTMGVSDMLQRSEPRNMQNLEFIDSVMGNINYIYSPASVDDLFN